MDVQVAERNGLVPGTPELRSVGPLTFGPDGMGSCSWRTT
jgi:hypothetical protein